MDVTLRDNPLAARAGLETHARVRGLLSTLSSPCSPIRSDELVCCVRRESRLVARKHTQKNSHGSNPGPSVVIACASRGQHFRDEDILASYCLHGLSAHLEGCIQGFCTIQTLNSVRYFASFGRAEQSGMVNGATVIPFNPVAERKNAGSEGLLLSASVSRHGRPRLIVFADYSLRGKM